MEYDVDAGQFWKDDETAHEENCFTKKAAQVALGIRMSDECVFAELKEDGEQWGYTPRERRIELNKRYNDRAEKIVGIRLLQEDFPVEEAVLPPFRMIGEVFGGEYLYLNGSTWLKGNCSTPEELEELLDRVDAMSGEEFRRLVLPSNWDSEKKRIYEQYGRKPELLERVRGPVTLAMSIYGVENFIYLYHDEPDLFRRFSDSICEVIMKYLKLFIIEAGYTLTDFPHGFHFYDDDCCLLTPGMYEAFGYPVLKKVFDYTAPDPCDGRFQHSDSAMGHLLPILSRLDLTGCNFGPTLTVSEIRDYCPHARIDGQLAPFTFMSNDEAAILREVRRDCEMAKENDLRGLNFSTAGSINNGTLLTSMRVVMYGIQRYGRY